MKAFLTLLGILILLCLSGCRDAVTAPEDEARTSSMDSTVPEARVKIVAPILKSLEGIPDTTFILLKDFSGDFRYDLRYATENNFLKAQVYDCARCYTRVKTAKALIAANADFLRLGYRIKFFDCYRPNSVQYKMWALVPDPQYVANPIKGSIHNKGGAVDITLVDRNDLELDMGTDFDFFGKMAYHDNKDLPAVVLENRRILRETMEKHGFWSIRTEWWHYNLSTASADKVANFKWACD